MTMLKHAIKRVLLFLLLLATLLLLSGCTTDQKPSVVIHSKNASAEPIRVTVELAQTAGQRSMGLMYRKRLGKTRGMLFLFDREQIHRFTMRNTAIPLDMIFINSSQAVVGILTNTKPYANGPFSINRPSQYVLEVNAGFCARNSIAIGDTIVFHNFPGQDKH